MKAELNRVFVTGVTGAQGGAIARVLNDSSINVASIAREREIDSHSTRITRGSLEDKTALTDAMRGCDAIVLTLPMLFEAAPVKAITTNVIAAARANGISRVIYNTSIPLGDNKTGYAAIDVKHDALALLAESGLEVITLMPTLYLDNLSAPFLLPVIQAHSILPYPVAADFEFSWLSHENLGRYCLAALERDDLAGEQVLITNRDRISGQRLADTLSQASGKSVNYAPATPDEFEANLKGELGDYVALEVANLYRGIDAQRASFQQESHSAFLDSVVLQSTADWASKIKW